VIGIIGAIILLPLAIIGLVVGLIRFAANALVALAEAGISRLGATG
jgi:hypothetical protein